MHIYREFDQCADILVNKNYFSFIE